VPIGTRILPLPLPLQAADVDRLWAIGAAVTAADQPGDRPLPASLVAAWCAPGTRHCQSVLVADGGAGQAVVTLPVRDNTHLAFLELQVHPSARRRGIGRALLEEAAAIAGFASRRELVTHTAVGGAGEAFAAAVGARVASTEGEGHIQRPAEQLARWEELAEAARGVAQGAGFAVERIEGACPDRLVESLAAAKSGMNDAPTGELDLEPRRHDAAEVREAEAAFAAAGVRQYRVVALRPDDTVAGYTELLVGSDDPGLGIQEDTTVLGRWRGHRLGLWLKAEMLAWLATAEPALEVVQTWNDVTNAHMLAVNDALGSRRVREWRTQVLAI